jgi:hypothetical protein
VALGRNIGANYKKVKQKKVESRKKIKEVLLA